MYDKTTSALQTEFPAVNIRPGELENRFYAIIGKEEAYDLLAAMFKLGFEHLSDVACVDYLSDNEFEVIYHIWSHKNKLRAIVQTRIPREDPHISSVSDIWPGAQIHERENWELFGIDFEGNPNLTPLFLEDWEEIPPFRKDFDSREYALREEEGS